MSRCAGLELEGLSLEIESLGSSARAVGAVGLLLVAAFGLGRAVVFDQTRKKRRSIESHGLRVAVGLNLIGTIGIALGSLQLLAGGRSIWMLAALGLVAVVLECCQWSNWRAIGWPGSKPRPKLLWFTASALALVTLGPALCYPTGWDELVYHHELPRRWRVDGWPALDRDLPYSGFPSLGEILFWLVSPIEGVIAPRLLGWVCWMLGLLFVYQVLRRRVRVNSAAVLTGAFALSSTVLMISANCYVETILMMNFAGLLLVMQQRRAACVGQWRKGAIVGVLAGGAAAVKLTGAAILFVPLIWYLAETWRDKRRAVDTVRSLAIYALVAIAIALPFYLRPWLLTGDPFYPYYAQWFSEDPARLEMSRYHHALGSAFGVRGPAAFVLAPVLLAFDKDIFDGGFGWQFLIVMGLAAVAIGGLRARRRGGLAVLPLMTFAGLYTFWFLTAQQARFAIPAAIALFLAATTGLRRVSGRWRPVVLGALVACTAVSAPWRDAGHYFGSWMSAVRLISRADYVDISTDQRDREYMGLIRAIGDETPRDARLMLLFEHRGFYVPRHHVIGTPLFQEAVFTPPEAFGDAAGIMSVLRRERISHVVMTHQQRGPDVAPGSRDRLEAFLKGIQECLDEGALHPIWESKSYALLEVMGPSATERAPSGSP